MTWTIKDKFKDIVFSNGCPKESKVFLLKQID